MLHRNRNRDRLRSANGNQGRETFEEWRAKWRHTAWVAGLVVGAITAFLSWVANVVTILREMNK